MIKFITDSSVPILKKKLTLLYVLNALDIVFTFALVKTGMFFEANKLMVPIIGEPIWGILLKLVLPAMLIIYVLLQIDKLPNQNLRLCNFCINVVLGVYVIINVLHVFYSIFYTVFSLTTSY
ncbi:MAG: DUF5658 family protein [Cellulosilyticaceae bacterium]